MPRRPRGNHSRAFKAKVALETIKGEEPPKGTFITIHAAMRWYSSISLPSLATRPHHRGLRLALIPAVPEIILYCVFRPIRRSPSHNSAGSQLSKLKGAFIPIHATDRDKRIPQVTDRSLERAIFDFRFSYPSPGWQL